MNQIQKLLPLYDLLAYSNKQCTDGPHESCSSSNSSSSCSERRTCSECTFYDLYLLQQKLGCDVIGEVHENTDEADNALMRKFVEMTPDVVDYCDSTFRTFNLYRVDSKFDAPFIVVIVAPTGHFLSVEVNQTARHGLLHDAASIRKVDCNLKEILCECWGLRSWPSYWRNWALVGDRKKLKFPGQSAYTLAEARKYFELSAVWTKDGKGGLKKRNPVDAFLARKGSKWMKAVVPEAME